MDQSSTSRLIDALRDPARYPHAAGKVRVLETHISWVLLAGRYAYKIKKPVDLGFLDFTQLAQRRHFCEEEIRLNHRLAPGVYLDVVAIGGSPAQPVLGAQPAIEYCVRMRRFPRPDCWTNTIKGQVSAQHIDSLAATVAAFHAGLPPAAAGTAYGTGAAIEAPAHENFVQLAEIAGAGEASGLARLEAASEREFQADPRIVRTDGGRPVMCANATATCTWATSCCCEANRCRSIASSSIRRCAGST